MFFSTGKNLFRAQVGGMHVSFSARSVEYRRVGARLRVDFENPNAEVSVEGEQVLPGVVNLLTGNDPAQWRTGVAVYASIRYRNLYPGIDLRYSIKDGVLKSEYLVAAGADPRRIRLSYGGARVEAAGGGELVVRSAEGELRESGIASFGRNRRKLHSRFTALGESVSGYDVTGAAQDEAVLIDPTITFSSYIGGSGLDSITAVAVDSANSIYAAGWSSSADFPQHNTVQFGLAGTVDAVVVKVDSLNNLVYATYLGGNDDDRGFGIAVDSSGNAILTGWTYSTNFPRLNAWQNSIGGGRDAFVAKLNASGNGLLFSTFLGGSDSDSGNAVAVDSSGGIYVAGDTASTGFPIQNAFQSTNHGGIDAFLAKYNTVGVLLFSTYLGGAGDDRATAVAVDSNNSAYVAGSTYSTNFPVANPFQPSIGGGQDAFVTKFSAAGNTLAYSTYLGGPDRNSLYESATGIAVDSAGNALVAGYTCSTSFPVLNAVQPAFGGGNTDGFISKLNSTGSGLVYSTYLGGASEDLLEAAALAADGGAIVAGYTGSSNFPIANAIQSSKGAGYDAVVTRLSPTGSTLDFSTFLGGNGADNALGIAVDSLGNLYVGGQTQSTDFPNTAALQTVNGGNFGGFLTRIQTYVDTVPPSISIVSPSATGTYSTSSGTLSVSGSSSDNLAVTQVTWSCDRCGSGTASGTTAWSISGIALAYGANVLTVKAWDAAGNSSTATLTITYLDVIAPTIGFTSPVSSGSYSTTSTTLSITGTAADNVGVVLVTWSCDRCGSGTAAGTLSWSVNGIALQAGNNVITVTASDAAGNHASASITVTLTGVVDNTPPTVAITLPVSTGSYNTSSSALDLAGTASDNVGVTVVAWVCNPCGTGTATGTSNWSANGIALSPGTNTIFVIAYDAAGNQAFAILTATYTPNATTPVVSILNPTASATYATQSSTLSLSGTASDTAGIAQVAWSCNRCGSGTASGTTNWSIPSITLQSGVNVISVTATNNTTGQGSATITVTYTPDTTPPTIAIQAPSSSGSYLTAGATLAVSGSASDNNSVTQVSWSCDRCGSGTATGTTAWSIGGITLLAGANVITVTARDGAGNQASATLTVTYDNVAPSLTVVLPVAGGTYYTASASLNMSGTAADNIGLAQVSWSCDRCGSGVAAGTTAWSISAIPLAAGSNVITVTARDGAGNQSSSTITVVYDAISPTVTIVSPSPGGTYFLSSSALNMSGTASDNIGVSQVSWSCDRCGSGVATGTTSWTISAIALASGSNVITVTAFDACGNQSSAILTVVYDNSRPTVSIVSPSTSGTFLSAVATLNVSGTAADNFGVTQVSWSCDRCGSGTASGTNNWSIGGITLLSGVNVLTVTARDASGNLGSSVLTVTYDNVPPTIAIVSPSASGTYLSSSASLSLSGTAADNVGLARITWSCDRCGSGVASGTASWSISGVTLQPGANAIAISAIDTSGNQALANITVTYDNVPPTLTIASPTSGGTYFTASSTLNMSGTAADSFGIGQVSWSCDRCGSGTATGTTSWSISGIALLAGINVITVTARDASGNRTSATLTVTYDASPPTIAITSPTTAGAYYTAAPTLSLSGTAADNTGITQVSWSCDRCGSGVAAGTTAWSLGPITLQAGVNVITVTAWDAAGNRASSSLNVTFSNTPPVVAIVAPTAATSYSTANGTLNLSGTAADIAGITQVSWSCDRCGSGVAAGTANWSVSGIALQPGVNAVTISAVNGVGNTSTATLAVTYDTTPPNIAITSPTQATSFVTTNGTLNLSGPSWDFYGVMLVTWRCDRCGSGTASGTASWSVSGIALQPGTNVINLFASDAAGNVGSATLVVTYAATPPSIGIAAPTNGSTYYTNSGVVTLSGTASDLVGVSQVSWQCDRCGSGMASGTNNWSIPGVGLQLGANLIAVSAVNAAGGSSSSTLTVIYDVTPPNIAVTSPTAATSYTTASGTLNLSGPAWDFYGVTQVSWQCDRCGNGVGTGSSSWAINGISLQIGVNTIYVFASDAAGNKGSAMLLVTYSPPDKAPPNIAITSPTSASTYATSNPILNLSGPSWDAVGVAQVTWQCDRCGSGVGVGTVNWSVSGIVLQPGVNIVNVFASDAQGKKGSSTLVVTYNAPPVIAIAAPTAASSYSTANGNLNVAGTASSYGGLSQIIWSCDRCGSGQASGTGSWSIAGIALQPGVNVITVTAVDLAGNRSSALLSVTFDTVPPNIAATSPTTATTYSTTGSQLNLSGAAWDFYGVTQVTWQCDRCGSGVASGTSSWSISGITLQPGVNVIYLFASDAAGNRGSETFVVTFDNVPPAIAIASPSASGSYYSAASSINLAGTASDNVAVAQVSWSCDRCGSGVAAGTTSWAISGIALQPGVNQITVTASDAAGNRSSAMLSVTLDNMPPNIAITAPTSTGTYSTQIGSLNLSGPAWDAVGVVAVTWQCDRCGRGNGVGTVSWSVSGIVLQPGLNVINVFAADAAGNKGSATLVVNYTPDTTPPNIAITAPTSAFTYATSSSALNLSGPSWDAVGVTAVSWQCDRCGSGVAVGTVSWSVSGIVLQPGLNVINVFASDAAGNRGSATLWVTYSPPPTITIVAPTTATSYSTANGSFNLSGTAYDYFGVTQVSWVCDRCGSGIASGSSNWAASGIALQPGANVITVTASDAAGNRASATLTVTFDNVPPNIAITSPTSATSYTTTSSVLNLSGPSWDFYGVTQVTWQCDRCGSGVASGTTSWSVAGILLQPGVNVIYVFAGDAAGNRGSATLVVTYNSLPTIAIAAPTALSAYSTANGSLTLGGTASAYAGLTRVTWSCDRCGSGTANGTTNWSVSGIALQAGVNLITVTALDAAGNRANATLTVTYDNVPPNIAITAPTSATTYSTTSSTLNLSGPAWDFYGVTQVSWQCDRCGSGSGVGTTSWSVTGILLQPGLNVINVFAMDAAGNKGSATITVTYSPPDTTPPSLAIATPISSGTYYTASGTLSIAGSASDNVAVSQVTWTCDRCGSGVATGTTSWNATNILLQTGANVITIFARDWAGNQSSAAITVVYDSTAPTIAITSPVTGASYSTASSALSLSGNAADNFAVAGVSWSCDRCGSGVAAGTTSWSVGPITLLSGVNVITVTARDGAGNTSNTKLSVTYSP